MILPINDDYRIASDNYQWIIQRRRKKKDQEIWESVSFYPSFSSALNSLGESMVRGSEAEGLSEALAAVKNVTTTLSHALTPELMADIDTELKGSDT